MSKGYYGHGGLCVFLLLAAAALAVVAAVLAEVPDRMLEVVVMARPSCFALRGFAFQSGLAVSCVCRGGRGLGHGH